MSSSAERWAECPRSPAECYLPRDFFFCFFTFRLTIGAFAPVPRDTGLGGGCFFDFPAMPVLLNRVREATDDPTLQAVGGCATGHFDRVIERDASELVQRRDDVARFAFDATTVSMAPR